jgi:hypothetical protein
MVSKENLDEARNEAQFILGLADKDVADLFFRETMRRQLSKTVRRLDRLATSSGDDRTLGEQALSRLGFAPLG